MAIYTSTVRPLQPWGQDGVGEVWITGEIDIHMFLPLKNDNLGEDQQTTIERNDFPKGLITINDGNLPKTPTVDIPATLTSKTSHKFNDWPHAVIIFV